MSTNRYGVDTDYFKRIIDRELNHGLENYTPDELARVFARMSKTAHAGVLLEPEFNPPADTIKAQVVTDLISECSYSGVVDGVATSIIDVDSAIKYADRLGEG